MSGKIQQLLLIGLNYIYFCNGVRCTLQVSRTQDSSFLTFIVFNSNIDDRIFSVKMVDGMSLKKMSKIGNRFRRESITDPCTRNTKYSRYELDKIHGKNTLLKTIVKPLSNHNMILKKKLLKHTI